MNVYFKRILIVLVGLIIPLFLFSQNEKLFLQKRFTDKPIEKRVHHGQEYFNRQRQLYVPDTKSSNFNKLLVLLVDFQEDDNPHTTGNGKFLLSPDDDNITYPVMASGFDIIGAPPHDRAFFEEQLRAVQYYYRAVSFEHYQLEFDVYPKNKQAYTLPHEMAYYNPVERELFIERIEQYFKDVFETADQDDDRPDSFGAYGHYMIIHAGSDYQHDVMGDTFHDIPSFFINIATGKEVYVDNGQTAIKTAANVPEMITQDIREHFDGEDYIYYGYGSVNSVFVHEFGHSLGFVDLYNTLNNRPVVGMFDIMDSGGSGYLVDRCQAGHYYAIEGALPALPSVWSRLIPFEEVFLQYGILRDISKSQLSTELNIKASSAKRENDFTTPYFYRIRLSEDEYILIENRNLDPDNDGATSLQSGLNGRVVLHPSPIYESGFTYEYDWLLPGWMGMDGRSYGGGLLIWHIDDEQIFKRGVQYDDIFMSNFDLNRVNTNIEGNKAVRVIEADNFHDLGNPYSYYWTGTPFEYYFKYKPILNEYGMFVEWSEEIHNNELSASSKPALITNQGKPSSWRISDISQAKRIMSFKISNSLFDNTTLIGMFPGLHSVSALAKLQKHQYGQIAVLNEIAGMTFYTHIVPEILPSVWEDYWYEEDLTQKPDFDISVTNFKHNEMEEFLLVYEDKIIVLDSSMRTEWVFNDKIIEQPMDFKLNNKSYLIVNFTDSTSVYSVNHQYFDLKLEPLISIDRRSKVVADNEYIYFLSDGLLSRLDVLNRTITDYHIDNTFNNYEPVVYVSGDNTIVFCMSDNGKIYSVKNNQVSLIFDLRKFSQGNSSNLALGYSDDMYGAFLVFHTEDRVFAITQQGDFLNGFPVYLENTSLQKNSFPYIVKMNDELIFLLSDTLQGLPALDFSGKLRYDYSHYWNKGNVKEQFFIERVSDLFMMLYADSEDNVFVAERSISPNDEIIWNSYRNQSKGMLYKSEESDISITEKPELFVYPNPVNGQMANIRIKNTQSKADVKIYSIDGQLVRQIMSEESTEIFRDVRFDTQNLSSGIYFAIVRVDGRDFRLKFAIVK